MKRYIWCRKWLDFPYSHTNKDLCYWYQEKCRFYFGGAYNEEG